MKYLSSWTLPEGETYRAAVKHFLKTGGVPPAGVTMLCRWHGANGKGFLIAESDDPTAVFTWLGEWREFMHVESTTALEDADMAKVLQSLYG